jgi:hypothetical protein
LTKVASTGRPLAHIPAYLKTDTGERLLRISARPMDGAVEVTLEDAEPAAGKKAS